MGVKDLALTSPADIIDACRKGDVERIRLFIIQKRHKRNKLHLFRPSTPQPGWLVAIRDTSSLFTPLHAAALGGHELLCKILLEADSQQAVSKDKKECLPLHLAAWNGHSGVVQLLVEAHPEVVDSPNCARETALHLAAQHGHVTVARMLLTKHTNASVRNARSETPLDIAARTGHAVVCKLLIGFCPELALQCAVDSVPTDSKRRPQTVYPLHAAARHSHIACMQILCLSGFDINYVTEEGSALHVAAIFGQVAACKFLTEQGINAHLRDSNGRTVLEMLKESESEKNSDLTHIIQSRDGWAECATIVQDYIEGQGSSTLNSSSDSGIDRRDVERHRHSEDEAIWQLLPTNANMHPNSQYSTSRRYETAIYQNSPTPDTRGSDRTSPDDIFDNTISIRSEPEPTSLALRVSSGTLPRTWSSKMYDPKMGIPRFPLTSPHNKARHHSSIRVSNSTAPAAASLQRTQPSPPRASILPCSSNSVFKLPAAPPDYNSWRRREMNGITQTLNPAVFTYDNIPQSSNTSQSATTQTRRTDDTGGSVGRSFSLKPNFRDGTQTLPLDRRRPVLNMSVFAPIPEAEKSKAVSQASVRIREDTPQRNVRSREESLMKSLANVSCRLSSTTFACSTLDRASESPRTLCSSPEGIAPLALPEDLTGSTTNSLRSVERSPAKDHCPMNQSFMTVSSATISLTDTPESYCRDTDTSGIDCALDTLRLHNMDDPPSPNTSQAKIYSILCNNSDIGEKLSCSSKQSGMISPTATECSASTMASSCSLPLISQISSTPPSVKSPTKSSHHAIGIRNLEGTSSPRPEIRLRNPMTNNSYRDSKREDVEIEEEWKKWLQIDRIMRSYGSAICRESVFASDYEKTVWQYLKDRRSKVNLARRSESLDTDLPESNVFRESSESRATSTEITIPQWLHNEVRLSRELATSVGNLMIENGYDRYSQLHGSMTLSSLMKLGVECEVAKKILTYLDASPDRRPSANRFEYISDWLCSLELIEYLSSFVSQGIRSIVVLKTANFSEAEFKSKFNVNKAGHLARMIYSLKRARAEDLEQRNVHGTFESATLPKTFKSKSRSPVEVDEQPCEGSVSYTAHYVGSVEISSVNGTEQSRAAISSLKKNIRDISKVPQVTLEISTSGVRILDNQMKELAWHGLCRIQIVCQDERDLNFFAYISEHELHYFCHVFCVLTADVATDVIMTLGEMFHIVYTQKSRE